MISVLTNAFGVTYDPVGQVLTISMKHASGHSQDLLTFTLQTLRDLGWPGASRWVGEAVLLLIPETRATFLPETKDDELPVSFLDRAISELENRADTAAEDQHVLSMLYLVRARLVKSHADLKLADKLLQQAARAGCVAAANAVRDTWPDAMSKAEGEISAR